MALLQTVILDGVVVGEVRTATANSVILALRDDAPEYLRRIGWRYPTTRSAIAAVEAAYAAEQAVKRSQPLAPEPQPEPAPQPEPEPVAEAEPAPEAPAPRTRRARKPKA